jgi:hypothetical protein
VGIAVRTAASLPLLVDPSPVEIGADLESMLESFGGPALIRVAGRDRSRCRLVVTLLHGNEPSGAAAIHSWLRAGETPAVDAVFIVASVAAALLEPRFSHRILPGTRDLNRSFLGPFDDASGRLAASILAAIEAARPECVVDVHNNTGHNPPYAIGTAIEPARLRLAAVFARRYIHSELRLGSLMEAVTAVPCVTVECGRAGDPEAARLARRGIDRLLGADGLAESDCRGMEILESMVRVRAREGLRLAVSDARHPDADLTITHDVDRHNFATLADGTVLGWVEARVGWPLEARDALGRDRSRELFGIDADGRLRSRGSWVPIMMTTDPAIASQDCLFYVVERRR